MLFYNFIAGLSRGEFKDSDGFVFVGNDDHIVPIVGEGYFPFYHGKAVHIINSEGIAYHQNEVLHIIIAKALCTLRVMIYTFGDDIHLR